MVKRMSSSILLPIIIFITLLNMEICCQSKNNNVTFDCVPSEKKALMMFKSSFSDDLSKFYWLSSWMNISNCCTWRGIKCDNATGHVVGLDLMNIVFDDDFGYYPSPDSMLRSDRIDSSLRSMKQLKYLILIQANFNGTVPHQLGNLSNLRALGLGGDFYGSLRAGDVTTWAGNLSSLEYLYMSGVDLSGTKDVIKVLINTLSSLVELCLPGSRLDDTSLLHANCVNSTLLFTSNVQYLDLSSNSFGENSSFCFLQNMASLEFLDLSRNSLHQKGDWISDLLWDKCHLKSLNLGGNRFYGDISEALIKNLSGCWSRNLKSINFEGNEFSGHLPEELGALKKLIELYVSGNKLSGPIPHSIGNLKALRVLDLADNPLLGGEIPFSLGQLSNLEWIDFSDNSLSGPIPHSLGNLSALRMLNLSYNQLGGEIPVSLGQLSNLESIRISGNNLSGPIPSSLGNLRALRDLGLSHNHLVGKIPISLGRLSNLERIGLYNNSFEGTLSKAHFAKLSRLEYLNIGLKFNVGDDWVPPFQLKHLRIGSNGIEGQFPQWLIRTQEALEYLDLSNCNIKGKLPAAWLRSLKNLTDLDLSNNLFEGPIIPQLPPSLTSLDLSRNFISESIPESLMCQIKGLQSLLLSRNHLSGHLPDCNWGNLGVVVLSYNQLSGPIPNSIGGGGARCSLQWLQLDNNRFTGQIPFSLNNCTDLSFLDIGDNRLTGELPQGIGNDLLELAVLRVRNNTFDGDIPSAYCQLSRLQIMDLAHNRLTGSIPRCFGSLSGMIHVGQGFAINEQRGSSLNEVMKGVMLEYTRTLRYLVNLDLSSNHLFGEIPLELTNLIALNGLNLSYNHLGGQIPQRIGDLMSLESLDLSNNNLSENIPGTLSKLTYLSHLNLSHNHLSGHIPTGNQLQTFNDNSSFAGNPGLCGDPLTKKCHISINEIPGQTRKVENDDGGMSDKIYLYAFITTGLATGFWGYFGVLVFKRTWRHALFRRMDALIAKMLGRY